jgi:hypothetical protein
MSVQQRIEKFYNDLQEEYAKLESGNIYKVESQQEYIENVVLKNDEQQDIKPYLEYYGKIKEGENYIHTFKYDFRNKNNTQIYKQVQWLYLADDSIISIGKF